jgi:hypothetical protein
MCELQCVGDVPTGMLDGSARKCKSLTWHRFMVSMLLLQYHCCLPAGRNGSTSCAVYNVGVCRGPWPRAPSHLWGLPVQEVGCNPWQHAIRVLCIRRLQVEHKLLAPPGQGCIGLGGGGVRANRCHRGESSPPLLRCFLNSWRCCGCCHSSR